MNKANHQYTFLFGIVWNKRFVPTGIITITTASNNYALKDPSFARELFTISIIFLLWKPQNSGIFVIKHIKNASFISLTAEDRYLVYRAYRGQVHLLDEPNRGELLWNVEKT